LVDGLTTVARDDSPEEEWGLGDRADGGRVDHRDKIRVLTDLSGFHSGGISRADVAYFVFDQVESDAWLRQSPLVGW
jgi:hypothetical protein